MNGQKAQYVHMWAMWQKYRGRNKIIDFIHMYLFLYRLINCFISTTFRYKVVVSSGLFITR